MARTLIIVGLVLVAAGLLWPVIGKLGLGRSPPAPGFAGPCGRADVPSRMLIAGRPLTRAHESGKAARTWVANEQRFPS
jgi:hypothetical protein